jgi:hypothetical protein
MSNCAATRSGYELRRWRADHATARNERKMINYQLPITN